MVAAFRRQVRDQGRVFVRTGFVGGCAAVLAGSAAALAACGGGGGSSASDDIKDSVNTFIKQHDCSTASAGYRKTLTGDSDVKKCNHDLSLRKPFKDVKIGKVSSSGSKGTAAVTTDGTKVTLTMRKQGDTWLIAGDSMGNSEKQASKTTPSTGSATNDRNVARTKYILALATYQAGRKRFRTRVLQDIRARNLAAVKGDFGSYRDTVFEFDGQVRKIKFPASMQEDVNHLLEADRTEIADLDAVSSANGFSQLQKLLTSRLQSDDNALSAAVKKVARDL
jgi:hypothetical protein